MAAHERIDAGPMEALVTPEMVKRWAETIGDEELLRAGAEALVPPALLFSLSVRLRKGIERRSASGGDDAVQAQYRMETHRPIRAGERLTITGQLLSRYIKREREYSVWDIRFRDEAGKEVAYYREEGLETYQKVGER
ncbi:MAG: MaoC family dehydratase N-terminal domain-containing protein [Dehalococcoidia bacterium]